MNNHRGHFLCILTKFNVYDTIDEGLIKHIEIITKTLIILKGPNIARFLYWVMSPDEEFLH